MSGAFVDNFVKVGTGKQLGRTGRFICQWCGYPVDARRRTNKAPTNEADGNTVETTDDVVSSVKASRGCTFCGRYNWAKQEPHNVDPNKWTRRRVMPVGRIFRSRGARF